MKILAIETSCDDTALCLMEATETSDGIHFSVLANVANSQIEIHRPFGGVFPGLAKREHQLNLPIILEQVMQGQDIPDYICVTSGPGLEPALWTGIVFAKEFAAKWSIPIIPVNHMEGHILSVLVSEQDPTLAKKYPFSFDVKSETIQFPALALLISGGHTELVLVKAIGDYEILGKTVDDAVGEAFDKVARILGLPYPGGPEISNLATQARAHGVFKRADFPRPMLHSPNLNFSFSGLKTAVLYYVQDQTKNPDVTDTVFKLTEETKQDIAREFENAVTDVLVHKTKKAVETFGAQTLIIGGGVSANIYIKVMLQDMIYKKFPRMEFLTPTRELSTDNAIMIALAGYFKIKKSPDAVYEDIRANGNLGLS